MQKDLWRYGITAILFYTVFRWGPIVHANLLLGFSEEEIRPLLKAYNFFAGMSLFTMIAMEWVAVKKPNKVILVNITSMMMKFGMFVVFYIGLEDYPQVVIHSMMVPMVYFLILQTIFIVVKLNQLDALVESTFVEGNSL